MEILPGIAPCHFPAGVAIFSRPDSNGQSRLVNGDSRIALIALPERRLIANLESPGGLPISDLEFSRDQRWLVAGAAQGEIQVWDLDIIRARLEEMKCSW